MKMADIDNLAFQLSPEGQPAEHPPLAAYLVGASGLTIETQKLGEKCTFKFQAAPESLRGARILIAPEMPDKNPRPTLEELRELNAYEPALKFDPKAEVQQIASIPAELWPKWNLCLCRVRGRVVKDFCYWLPHSSCRSWPSHYPCPLVRYCFPLPVCSARVHICRVKPRLISDVTDVDILRLRTELLGINPPRPRDPGGPITLRRNPDEMQLSQRMENGNVQPLGEVQSAASQLSPTFRFKLESAAPELLRRAIEEHRDEIKPLIAHFDWCNFLYYSQEIAVVSVDDQGRFDTLFFYDCSEKQNLYFWVEYLYNIHWVTVYRPSLCSGTFWNYQCGLEVVLKTSDSRVTGCRPITGRFLEITRIGSFGWLPRIDASLGFLQGVDLGDSTHDVSGATINSASYTRPFGGVLALQGNFGFNLPDPALATHYRVSYKPSSLPSDIESNWIRIDTPLSRAYNDTLDVGGGLSRLVTSTFQLKDPVFPDFYRIPKENADQQSEIPHGADLQDRRWAQDEFTIAVLDTEARNLDPGSYDLRIQLCRAPSPGAAPQPVSVRREVFEMPDPANLNQSTFCDEAHLIQSTPGGPDALAFRMRVAVDRRHCTSSIADAAVDGTVSDPDCGILPRGGTLRLGFTASHSAGLATFSFGVVRGNGNPVGVNTAGLVSAVTAENGYGRAGTEFSNAAIVVNNLFTGTSCTSAAFAETLSVIAMATDGSTRISTYDAPFRSAAFAIVSS